VRVIIPPHSCEQEKHRLTSETDIETLEAIVVTSTIFNMTVMKTLKEV